MWFVTGSIAGDCSHPPRQSTEPAIRLALVRLPKAELATIGKTQARGAGGTPEVPWLRCREVVFAIDYQQQHAAVIAEDLPVMRPGIGVMEIALGQIGRTYPATAADDEGILGA